MAAFLSKIKSLLLMIMDAINIAAEPFDSFTRPLVLPPNERMTDPEARLRALNAKYEQLLVDNRHVQDHGRLFVSEIDNDMGDICIWQGVYTAYRVLAAAADGGNMRELDRELAIEGLLLHSKERLVRGVAPRKYPHDIYHIDPSWKHFYFKRDERLHREDASLDSLAGWIFGMACALRYGNSPEVRAGAIRYAEQFKADKYMLRNRDGWPTEHGNIVPGSIQGPIRNLAAATIMRLGDCAGRPNNSWREIAKEYREDFTQTETHVLWKRGWHNDHMAILIGVAYAMVTPEDEIGGKEAREGIRRLLNKHQKMGNSFLIHAARLAGVYVSTAEKQKADQVLLEFKILPGAPDGKIPVHTVNSGRSDIKTVKWNGKLRAAQPLPIWQRPAADIWWQRDPFDLDGYKGQKTPYKVYSGLDFLIAYWCRQLADKSEAQQ